MSKREGEYPRELIRKVISESGMDDVDSLAEAMRNYLRNQRWQDLEVGFKDLLLKTEWWNLVERYRWWKMRKGLKILAESMYGGMTFPDRRWFRLIELKEFFDPSRNRRIR